MAARCVSCVPPFSLVPLPLFTYVDATALCGAALSLKRLNLGVKHSTDKAVASIFSLQNLELLDLTVRSTVKVSRTCTLYPTLEVCSACSPGKCVVMWCGL